MQKHQEWLQNQNYQQHLRSITRIKSRKFNLQTIVENKFYIKNNRNSKRKLSKLNITQEDSKNNTLKINTFNDNQKYQTMDNFYSSQGKNNNRSLRSSCLVKNNEKRFLLQINQHKKEVKQQQNKENKQSNEIQLPKRSQEKQKSNIMNFNKINRNMLTDRINYNNQDQFKQDQQNQDRLYQNCNTQRQCSQSRFRNNPSIKRQKFYSSENPKKPSDYQNTISTFKQSIKINELIKKNCKFPQTNGIIYKNNQKNILRIRKDQLIWQNFLLGKRIIEAAPVISKQKHDMDFKKHQQLSKARASMVQNQNSNTDYRMKKLKQHKQNITKLYDNNRLQNKNIKPGRYVLNLVIQMLVISLEIQIFKYKIPIFENVIVSMKYTKNKKIKEDGQQSNEQYYCQEIKRQTVNEIHKQQDQNINQQQEHSESERLNSHKKNQNNASIIKQQNSNVNSSIFTFKNQMAKPKSKNKPFHQVSECIPSSILQSFNFYFLYKKIHFQENLPIIIQIKNVKKLDILSVGSFSFQFNHERSLLEREAKLFNFGKIIGSVKYTAYFAKKEEFISKKQ